MPQLAFHQSYFCRISSFGVQRSTLAPSWHSVNVDQSSKKRGASFRAELTICAPYLGASTCALDDKFLHCDVQFALV